MLPSRWMRWALIALCALLGIAGALVAAAKSRGAAEWETIPSREVATDAIGDGGSLELTAKGVAPRGHYGPRLEEPVANTEVPYEVDHSGVAGGRSSEYAAASQSVKSALERGILDINRATVSDFDSLPGIGPRLAERVVQLRKEKGRFESVDDLLEVKGIGPSKLERLRPLATVKVTGAEHTGG